MGSQPLKTAVVLFTYPREQLSGYTDPTVEAMYRDDPTVVTYYKNLWRDMFTQACDDQSIMPINEVRRRWGGVGHVKRGGTQVARTLQQRRSSPAPHTQHRRRTTA